MGTGEGGTRQGTSRLPMGLEDGEFSEWKFAASVSARERGRRRASESGAGGGVRWRGVLGWSWEARLGVTSLAGRGGGGFPSAFFFDSEKNCKNPQPPPLRLASPGAGGASEWNDGLCVR